MLQRRSLAAILLGASALAATVAPTAASAQQVNRIVAFGDSYADDGNAVALLLANPLVPASTKQQLAFAYPTGRFTGGINYIDTLSQLLAAPVDNFAIGGALTSNLNTNGPVLPGFTTEYNAFLSGNTLNGVFPASNGTFREGDLLAVSIGGNDARFYQRNGGTLAGAPAAAAVSVREATAGLNALVGAGAPTVSFLAGNTAALPEVANDPAARAIRNAFSTTFNSGIQSTLAGYAANGTIVHYLDLTLMLNQVQNNLAAYGLTGLVCPAFPDPTCLGSTAAPFLFYGDFLHPTSQGSAIIARYIAAQLQAPLMLQAPSDLGLDTARQFGRTLTSRLDLGAPRDGDLAEGVRLFIVGDSFSHDVEQDRTNDPFDIDGVGVTVGATYGFGNGVVGLAGNYTRPRAKFTADESRTEGDSWQIGGFAGYALGPVFAQGYAGYGRDDYDIDRKGVIDELEASTDGDHWLAGIKAGYLMPVGVFRAGPVAALDYARAKVDGYTETGDEALRLNVDSISAKSLTGGIGVELRGDFEGGGVQVRPFASAMLEAEFSGDNRTVRFAQTASPGIVNSWRLEDRSKEPYGRFAAGGSAHILPGAQLNALLSGTVGRDHGDDVSAHVGLNVGF